MSVMASPTATIVSCLALTMSARRAAVVSSVSRVPRSFSPAMASAATIEPPASIRNITSGVRKRPRRAPPSRCGVATFASSTRASLSGSMGKPRARSRLSRRSICSACSRSRRRPRAEADSSLLPR